MSDPEMTHQDITTHEQAGAWPPCGECGTRQVSQVQPPHSYDDPAPVCERCAKVREAVQSRERLERSAPVLGFPKVSITWSRALDEAADILDDKHASSWRVAELRDLAERLRGQTSRSDERDEGDDSSDGPHVPTLVAVLEAARHPELELHHALPYVIDGVRRDVSSKKGKRP